MKMEIKWGIAIFLASFIGYVPIISDYTSKNFILGIPIFVFLLMFQTIIVLGLLIFVGLKKDTGFIKE